MAIPESIKLTKEEIRQMAKTPMFPLGGTATGRTYGFNNPNIQKVRREKNWVWRDAVGVKWTLADMSTRHLISSLVTAWNGLYEKLEYHVEGHYGLSSQFHTDQYLRTAIPQFIEEAKKRKDLGKKHKEILVTITLLLKK